MNGLGALFKVNTGLMAQLLLSVIVKLYVPWQILDNEEADVPSLQR